MARPYRIYICGPTDCPNDAAFEHDGYFGCVPKDFSPTTGRSKSHRQSKVTDPSSPVGYRYRWNGGCDHAERSNLVVAGELNASSSAGGS